MTASIALLVISLPHEGPMALRETSSVGTWPMLASSSVTALISVVLPVTSPGGLDLDVVLARWRGWSAG